MTFPELTVACRTDEFFRLEANEDHHLTHCPLVDTGVDMDFLNCGLALLALCAPEFRLCKHP